MNQYNISSYNQIIQIIKNKYPNEYSVNIDKYGKNFLKKLKQLINLINKSKNQMEKICGENINLFDKIKNLFKIFLKKSPSSYLRLEHCQQLFDEYSII